MSTPQGRLNENEFEDDESDGVSRKPSFYVRFDRIYEAHSGPMFGPYLQLSVVGALISGVKYTGEEEALAYYKDTKWHLVGPLSEPGYITYSVVFS